MAACSRLARTHAQHHPARVPASCEGEGASEGKADGVVAREDDRHAEPLPATSLEHAGAANLPSRQGEWGEWLDAAACYSSTCGANREARGVRTREDRRGETGDAGWGSGEGQRGGASLRRVGYSLLPITD